MVDDDRREPLDPSARARPRAARPASVHEVRGRRRPDDPRGDLRRAPCRAPHEPLLRRDPGRLAPDRGGPPRRPARRAADPVGRLQTIHRHRPGGGRAWPHDIALGADGRPVVVYTLRHGGPHGTDVFTYAIADARGRWTSRRIVSAGSGYRTYTSGGATLDHDDPRLVLLSRTIGTRNQVEAWFTPDRGRRWHHVRITAAPDRWSIRPVLPRGLHGPDDLLLYVTGDDRTRSYADFHTRVMSWTGALGSLTVAAASAA